MAAFMASAYATFSGPLGVCIYLGPGTLVAIVRGSSFEIFSHPDGMGK